MMHSLLNLPKKVFHELQMKNAQLIPRERYQAAITMGLSALEEAYFVVKNAIDTSRYMSERVLYAEDYHATRIAEYAGQKRLCIFVPGYMQTSVGFYRLESLLGIEIFDAFTYVWQDFPYSQDIRLSGEQFANIVRDLNDQLHPEEIYLIGHSQGGLIIRTALQYGLLIDLPVRKYLSLNTPHQGTWIGLGSVAHGPVRKLAGIIPYIRSVHGESGLQMLPQSKFLTDLNDRPLPSNIEYYAIHYAFDPMVLPPSNAKLPYKEAHNFYIAKVGHTQPLYCSRASRILIRCLFGDWTAVPKAHGIQDERDTRFHLPLIQ